MSQVNIPDPQLVEIQALDEVFWDWVKSLPHTQNDDYEYWTDRWIGCKPSEPLVFTQDDIYEGWGDDYEMFINDVTPAMEKDLDTEIRLKREVLAEINGSLE